MHFQIGPKIKNWDQIIKFKQTELQLEQIQQESFLAFFSLHTV